MPDARTVKRAVTHRRSESSASAKTAHASLVVVSPRLLKSMFLKPCAGA